MQTHQRNAGEFTREDRGGGGIYHAGETFAVGHAGKLGRYF